MPAVSGTQYATRTDLANLGLIGGVLGSIATGVQDAALIAASGVADSEIQGSYVLPLTSWGQDLVLAVCKLAAYDLMGSKGYNPAAGADPNIRQRYLDALEWLEKVGTGEKRLSGAIDSSVAQTGQTTPPPLDGSTVFTSQGGFQLQTSPVRGWTGRGAPSPPGDNGTGSL